MRKQIVALAMAAAAMAACSKPTPGRTDNGAAAAPGAPSNAAAPAAGTIVSGSAAAGNSTAASTATAAAAITPLNPGEWETSIETKIAGLPPQVAKMMSGQKVMVRHCVTPEEAAKPKSDLFTGKKHSNCTGEQLALTGGRLHSVMECKDARGGASTMTMDGQYGGDSYDVSMTISGNDRGRQMRMESHTTGRRVAPSCSAAAEKVTKGPSS
jgi:hypothetical protein